jgi:hypothetical protein
MTKPTDYNFTTDDPIALEIAREQFGLNTSNGEVAVLIRSLRLPVAQALPVFMQLFALWPKVVGNTSDLPIQDIVRELTTCHKLFVDNSVFFLYDPTTPAEHKKIEGKAVDQFLSADYPNYAGWLMHCAQLNFFSFLDTRKQQKLRDQASQNKMFLFLTSGGETKPEANKTN